MSGMPPNLSFFMSRLQGFSTSYAKVEPQGPTEGSAGKIVRFALPSNSYLMLNSCKILCNVELSAGTAAQARMPAKMTSFVDRVAVYVGGVMIQNGYSGYNVLSHGLSALKGKSNDDSLQGHPEMVRATSYHTGTALSGAESYTNRGQQLCISLENTFLSTAAPSCFDTGLVGQIVVELVLADDAVCASIDGTGMYKATDDGGTVGKVGAKDTKFKLTNMSLQCEIAGFASSVVDALVESTIANTGYISVPFKQFFTFTNSHSLTSRWSVNSASWDAVYFMWRNKNYSTQAGFHPVPGYKIAGGPAATITGTPDIGVPSGVDEGGVLNSNQEKYVSPYFRFQEELQSGVTHGEYQLQINGASVPSFRMTSSDFLRISLNSVSSHHIHNTMTMKQYRDSFFVQAMRFSLPDSDIFRVASGLDTRSVSANCAIETPGVASDANLTIVCECTSELRVGASRAIECIN